MATPETIAALERAASQLETLATWGRYRIENEQRKADAATIRAHIIEIEAEHKITSAIREALDELIASGAHEEQQP